MALGDTIYPFSRRGSGVCRIIIIPKSRDIGSGDFVKIQTFIAGVSSGVVVTRIKIVGGG